MHPCCWGNLIQTFLQAVPVLALLVVAFRKIPVFFLPKRLPVSKGPEEAPVKSCCQTNEPEVKLVLGPGLDKVK